MLGSPRHLIVGLFVLFAFMLALQFAVAPTVNWYNGWLSARYDAAAEYERVYAQQTVEEGKSPMAADTDAGCTAMLPYFAGWLVIFLVFEGMAVWLAYKGADALVRDS